MGMKAIREFVKHHFRTQKGQGIVEYALILGFVVAVAAALTNTGGFKDSIENAFTTISNSLPGGSNSGNNNTNTSNP